MPGSDFNLVLDVSGASCPDIRQSELFPKPSLSWASRTSFRFDIFVLLYVLNNSLFIMSNEASFGQMKIEYMYEKKIFMYIKVTAASFFQ